MMRLRSRYPEIINGKVVNPGEEFDESTLPEDVLKRLKADGRAVPVKSASKSSKGGD